jgi:hypothetical protein
MLLFVVVCVCSAEAQDARISVFDRYNHASAYDDIKPVVSGVLAKQYALRASRYARQLEQLLKQQQLASYRPRLVNIDNATSFLVLDNVTSKSQRATSAQAYVVSKSPSGVWTLANRVMPGAVLKTLWTTRFTPTEFVHPSSCSIDGRDIGAQSVLAVRQRDSIEVTLYPFAFSQADLAYWRQVSGMDVNDADVAASHFNGPKAPVCRLIVKMDPTNHLSLLNVGFDDPTRAPAVSKLWQPSKADVLSLRLSLENEKLDVATTGAVGTDRDGVRWNLTFKVPVWEKGL